MRTRATTATAAPACLPATAALAACTDGGGSEGSQDRWVKSSASDAQPGDGLSACTREFTSFGTAKRGGTHTFSVATEGEPLSVQPPPGAEVLDLDAGNWQKTDRGCLTHLRHLSFLDNIDKR